MGQPVYLAWKHNGDSSILVTQTMFKGMANSLVCKTRTLWQRLDCLNANLDGVS